MTTNHLERLAKLFQDEAMLIQELYSTVKDEESKNLFADRVSSIIGRQDGRLQTLANEISLRASLPELVRMVGDLLINQNQVDSKLKSRAEILYSQKTISDIVLKQGDREELSNYYERMELAQRQGEVFWFGSYVHRQIETIVNIFFGSLSSSTINADLKIVVNPEKSTDVRGNKNPDVILAERIFNSFAFSENHQKNLDTIKSSQTLLAKNFDFRSMVKYFYWYFKQKKENKSNVFFIVDNPYYYLITARNVDSHGGNSAKTHGGEERKRIEAMKGNPAFYFCLFNALLNEFHKILFDIKNLSV